MYIFAVTLAYVPDIGDGSVCRLMKVVGVECNKVTTAVDSSLQREISRQ